MKVFIKGILMSLVSLIVFCLVLIIGLNVFLSNNLSKREIFRLVDKYSVTILEDISENNFYDTLNLKGVTDVVSKNVTDVKCGGKGFASATSYYGFYYNEKDEPAVVFNGVTGNIDESEFVAEKKGFAYRENNSDNTYYTEKIISGFYYYEWHF